MKVIIVGGVAGGASCAARLRRLDEQAEIVMLERTRLCFLRQLRPALLRGRRHSRKEAPDPANAPRASGTVSG